MLVDIHVHTNRYSDCGVDDPDSMVQAAIDVGLDALVFTEHNYQWTEEETQELQEKYPRIKLFRGIEVSVSIDEHIVVVGVSDPDLFYPLMPAGELMDIARYYSGAAVLAHPFRWSDTVIQDILDAGFDGIEVFSNSIREYMVKPILDLQQRRNVPLVATSDGHDIDVLGIYAIDVNYEINTEQELAMAIRKGDFSLWVDEARVKDINSNMAGPRIQAMKLLEEGATPRAALRLAGLSPHLGYALQKGLDISYPSTSSLDTTRLNDMATKEGANKYRI